MYSFFILDCSIVLTFFVTYGSILIRIIRNREQVNIARQSSLQRRKSQIFQNNKRFFKVAGLILFTYIVLMLIPNTILLFVAVGNYTKRYMYALSCFGLISDPIIYIFMQPDLRKMLQQKICRSICKIRRSVHTGSSANAQVNDTYL